MIDLYLMVLSMGFLGSIHCVGMCGGLVTALSMSRPKTWWYGLLTYQLGRIISYAMLGLFFGLIGMGLLAGGGKQMQQALAIFAGVVMVIFGLNLAGFLPDLLQRMTAWASRHLGLTKLVYQLSRDARLRGWFVLGTANGLLPCGLVYAALSLATSIGNVGMSFSMMLVFGVGTIPAMMLAPVAIRRFTPELRGRFLQLAGLLLIVMGAITVMRGGVPMHN